jgi:hypothetical protein
MEQPILLALIALGSALVTALIPRLFTRKKDTVDMFAELQERLYAEIERLEKKITVLEKREAEATELEARLIGRIAELEQQNVVQAIEINRLKTELEKYVKNS